MPFHSRRGHFDIIGLFGRSTPAYLVIEFFGKVFVIKIVRKSVDSMVNLDENASLPISLLLDECYSLNFTILTLL